MTSEQNRLDPEEIHGHLDNGNMDAALVSVCTYAETERRRQRPVIPDDDYGRQLTVLLDRIYETCIDQEMVEEYALFFQATRYVPHGVLVQPMLDQAVRRFSGRDNEKRRSELSAAEKDVIRIFIELSLEAYDKLNSFRIFVSEFREFIPFASLPKAIAIARTLGDEQILRELTSSVLHPPEEE